MCSTEQSVAGQSRWQALQGLAAALVLLLRHGLVGLKPCLYLLPLWGHWCQHLMLLMVRRRRGDSSSRWVGCGASHQRCVSADQPRAGGSRAVLVGWPPGRTLNPQQYDLTCRRALPPMPHPPPAAAGPPHMAPLSEIPAAPAAGMAAVPMIAQVFCGAGAVTGKAGRDGFPGGGGVEKHQWWGDTGRRQRLCRRLRRT